MNLLTGIEATTDALNAEKVRMNVVAQNIANAFTTRDVNGEVYKRKMVAFESYVDNASKANGGDPMVRGVRISHITEDDTPSRMIYNPQHPDANAEGMVEMPNVEMSREMVDMITSTRAYEANLQVVRHARRMAQQALAIGR